jgi:LysM repeat protein
MKLVISLIVCALVFGLAERSLSAQPSYGATAYAQQQQAEERWRKLSSQMEEMLASQEVLRKRVQMLEEENRRLTRKLNESGSASVTPAQLDRVAKDLNNKIQQVDKNRQADQKTVTREVDQAFDRLKKLIEGQSVTPSASPGEASSGKYVEYTIQSGQTISAVVKAYRDQGYKVSTDSILRANPGLKPNRLQVGQVIKIPIN